MNGPGDEHSARGQRLRLLQLGNDWDQFHVRPDQGETVRTFLPRRKQRKLSATVGYTHHTAVRHVEYKRRRQHSTNGF